MRLPADAALLLLGPADGEAIDALRQAWTAEALPILEAPAEAPFADGALERALDALGATTLVLAGPGGGRAARQAAALGYRLFVVEEACPGPIDIDDLIPDAARLVPLSLTLQAAAQANFRKRWRAARRPAG
jgi:hypothetical protein